MLAFSNMLDLFVDELSRLRSGRLAFARILTRPLKCFFFRHHSSFETVRARPSAFNKPSEARFNSYCERLTAGPHVLAERSWPR
jgi:hypothetical protein